MQQFRTATQGHWAITLSLCFSLINLVACSNTPIKFIPGGDGRLPNAHTIADVPYFAQVEDQCGPASLATMLAVRNISVTPQALRQKIYIPAKQGSLTTEMVSRARRYHLLVYPVGQNLADVFAEVSADNPVLVLQNIGLDWLPRWHFSVVIGYDLAQQSITLRSGEALEHRIGLALFLTTWERAKRWAVVMTEPDDLPSTAQAERFLQSANELEQIGETQAALSAYKAALTRWPQNTLAYFGAGNTAYALHHYRQASEFFSTYISHTPGVAAAWNNLAYSLLKLNCADDALTAVSCAVHLAPNDSALLASYTEVVAAHPRSSREGRCDIPKCPL